MKPDKIFSLKISLNGSSPSIWRRILVPTDYSFFDLHCAMQNAMGWFDSHLHGFVIGQKGTARTISIKFPDPEGEDSFWEDDDYKDERKEKISDYFGKLIKQCIEYEPEIRSEIRTINDFPALCSMMRARWVLTPRPLP